MKDSKDTEKTDYSDILELYGSDDNPLEYMIEPRGTVVFEEKNHKTTVEELQDILPELNQLSTSFHNVS